MPDSSVSLLQVALPVPLPQLFSYLPAASHGNGRALIGARVKVPFGSRELVGIISTLDQAPQVLDSSQLKAALNYYDQEPLFAGELLNSLNWLAQYLHAPLGEVFATALPNALKHGACLPETRLLHWQLTDTGHAQLPNLRQGKPRQLAELLYTSQSLSDEQLNQQLPGWRSSMRSLAKRELVQQVPAHPAHVLTVSSTSSPILNAEQQAAVAAIHAQDQEFAPFLLDGVTGSGKTEVYLHAIQRCLERGRQALVLIPEIGLTPQLLARFQARLNVPIHVTHSGLSDNARLAVWTAAKRGDARVIIGTRSAVFTPLIDPGLIIVDEEHDGSYKQQDGIRYNARDVAMIRAKHLAIPIVLGSATPSLESLHNAASGRYQSLRLHARAGDASAPRIQLMDLRKRRLQSGLCDDTLDLIKQTVARNEQVLVFKNRRGYAPALICHDCGWSAHCTRCDAVMTTHQRGQQLQCHHCGARRPAPRACPDCASLALQPQGTGTERLEEFLQDYFSETSVIRIDSESTQRQNSMQAYMQQAGSDACVLVGTQILAKGHDLPNLTLVVIVNADEGLYSADVRAGEKLAQLLIQVAGRAGRADKPGHVILQTHSPDHPLFSMLLNGGYHSFAEHELTQRHAAQLPPYSHAALLRAEAKNSTAPFEFLREVKTMLEDYRTTAIEISGPVPAPMPKRAGSYRAQLLLNSTQRSQLHAVLHAVQEQLYTLPQARKVRWSLDIDPVDFY